MDGCMGGWLDDGWMGEWVMGSRLHVLDIFCLRLSQRVGCLLGGAFKIQTDYMWAVPTPPSTGGRADWGWQPLEA